MLDNIQQQVIGARARSLVERSASPPDRRPDPRRFLTAPASSPTTCTARTGRLTRLRGRRASPARRALRERTLTPGASAASSPDDPDRLAYPSPSLVTERRRTPTPESALQRILRLLSLRPVERQGASKRPFRRVPRGPPVTPRHPARARRAPRDPRGSSRAAPFLSPDPQFGSPVPLLSTRTYRDEILARLRPADPRTAPRDPRGRRLRPGHEDRPLLRYPPEDGDTLLPDNDVPRLRHLPTCSTGKANRPQASPAARANATSTDGIRGTHIMLFVRETKRTMAQPNRTFSLAPPIYLSHSASARSPSPGAFACRCQRSSFKRPGWRQAESLRGPPCNCRTSESASR